jgi:hypothetical protein
MYLYVCFVGSAFPAFDRSLFPMSIDLSLSEVALQRLESISARTGLSVDEVATYLLDRALQKSSHLA